MDRGAQTLPVGEIVDGRPAIRPGRVALDGRFVRLVPLGPEHADDIFAATDGAGRPDVWTYMHGGPYARAEDLRAALIEKAAADDAVFHALVDPASGRALGYQSLMRIDLPNRVVEVGNVLYSPALQRSAAATEAQALYARHVFDDLGFRRYEWKCNALNSPSRAAALRLGFAYEGTFRSHMIVKGRTRDTAWFAMTDADWPARRAAFERWLAAENFDALGRQRAPLAALRDGG
ncbi:MAG: GNAT family N-acetyltransferase [Hyphomicrobiales bacterium]|nr:GNAT family N-acetyltransferase [Hyphomicrobiales bacterium]MDE2016352.1 GNAT family N-acetyltransferase [Hyphomicrobiales bacterium]